MNRLFLVISLVAASVALAACQKKSEEETAPAVKQGDTNITIGADGKRRDSVGYIILEDGRRQRPDGVIIESSESISIETETSETVEIVDDSDLDNDGINDDVDEDDDGDGSDDDSDTDDDNDGVSDEEDEDDDDGDDE